MVVARVPVSKSLLLWAIERSGKSIVVKQKFQDLDKWLSGEKQPTLRQLEKFARATYTPLGYLFLSEPPDERLSIPHFRTRGNEPSFRPSPDLLETVQIMERRQAWMREYLIEQGHEPLPFVRSARVADEPEQVASEMRRVLRLTEDWAATQSKWNEALRQLEIKTEEAGILVMVSGIVGNNTRRKLDPSEFRGFVLVDDYAPLVFINSADGKAAQMFTLAHELAHIWLGSSAAFDLRELHPADNETEQACNRIAAEFLVPAIKLRKIWSSVKQGPESFQFIARQFKVSEIVIARRALDIGLITKSQFFDFYEEYQSHEYRAIQNRSKGGNSYRIYALRLGRRFAEAVIGATREGKLLYRDAYRLTGLYGETFEKFARFIASGGPL